MEEKLQEIINILKDNTTSNIIATLSLVVAIVAVVITIISNIKNNQRYINSLKPVLIFKLYEKNGFLVLCVKNNGQSGASNIKIDFLSIDNNEDMEFSIDDVFKNEFMLYPSEETQGIIMYCKKEVSPNIKINVRYIQENDNKLISYQRSIVYKKEIEIRDGIDGIIEEIKSIAYSNNRLANYIEGRTLFKFDELNVIPKSSLYKDLKDAINNNEREEFDKGDDKIE